MTRSGLLALDDDFRLAPESLLLDAGDDSDVPLGLFQDRTGGPRVIRQVGAGAHERRP